MPNDEKIAKIEEKIDLKTDFTRLYRLDKINDAVLYAKDY